MRHETRDRTSEATPQARIRFDLIRVESSSHVSRLPSPVSSRRKRAKRAVTTGIGAFLLATLLLNVAMDTTCPQLRDPEFGTRLAGLKAAAADPRPLVLFLGSSRTQMAVRPSLMGTDEFVGYSLGQSGAGTLHLKLNLDRVLAAGVRPEVVLFEVMPPALTQDGPAEQAFHETYPRLGAADLPRLWPYCDDPTQLAGRWLAGRANPWSAQRFVLVSHAAPWLLPWQQRVDFQWRDVQPDGALPYPFVPTVEFRRQGTEKVRKDYTESLAAFHVAPVRDRALRDALARCRAEGIRAGLYLLPEGESFRALYPPAARAAVTAYVTAVSAEFGVPAFDATDWLPDDELYADGHHMLPGAASVFSQRFGGECLRPWLAGGR